MIKPMLANPVDIDDIPKKAAGYIMQPKLDGVRCIADTRDGLITLSTRTGKDLTAKLPHIAQQLEAYPDCVFDGEVGYFDELTYTMDFNRTMRVLGSGVEVAIGKQYGVEDEIKFCTFDLLWNEIDGDLRDHPEKYRRSELFHSLGLTYSSDCHEGDIFHIDNVPSWEFEAYEAYVRAGGEGVILKNPEALYVEGKRPTKTWYKVKKFDTMDVVVLGFLAGQGKYEGQIGAIWFGAYHQGQLITLGKCSGMTDEVRTQISIEKDNFIGRVLEIRYFGNVGKDKAGMRHPQFVRFRDDKLATECVMP